MKFSQVTPNTSLTLADFLMGVTAGNVDFKATNQTLINLLNASNKFNSGAIDWTANQGKIWWEELANVTLGSNGDSLSTGTFAARKHLQIRMKILNSGAVTSVGRFNNDAATNYALRFQSGGSFGTAATIAQIGNFSSGSIPCFTVLDVINEATLPKFGKSFSESGSTSSGTVPDEVDLWFKWVNIIDQITRFDLVNTDSGDLLAGSQIIVLGHN